MMMDAAVVSKMMELECLLLMYIFIYRYKIELVSNNWLWSGDISSSAAFEYDVLHTSKWEPTFSVLFPESHFDFVYHYRVDQ
jgi:hypothetical protein